MKPHVERMLEERNQLQDRVDKLAHFIDYNPLFGDLIHERQKLMNDQLTHMRRYLDVLNQRIQLETE